MSSSNTFVLADFIIGIAVIAIFSYGSYWAFQIRSALMNRLYRRRALWVGAASAFFALLIFSNLVIGSLNPNNFYLSLLQFGISYLGAMLTFAWIDTSVRVAIESDPLRRNTLHWSGLRIFIWFVLAISTAGPLFSIVIHNTNYFTSAGGPEGAFIAGPYGDNVIFSVAALILCRRRTGDIILKRHLKWLLAFVIALFFATSLLNNPAASIPRLWGSLLLIVLAYCLYKAARSLSPVSHIPPSEIPAPLVRS